MSGSFFHLPEPPPLGGGQIVLDRAQEEAAAADVGIAGGNGEGLVFRKGEVLRKVPQDKLVDALMEEIERL